jgi:hypothetical protein
MFSAGVSGIRSYGPTMIAFAIVVLLAGVLIERRILSARPAPTASSLAAVPVVPMEGALPDLRRIVLDPCTGLEKAALTPAVSPQTAKAD